MNTEINKLTYQQYAILDYVSCRESTWKDIASFLSISSDSGHSGTISKMIKAGLVSRTWDRKYIITKLGLDALKYYYEVTGF